MELLLSILIIGIIFVATLHGDSTYFEKVAPMKWLGETTDSLERNKVLSQFPHIRPVIIFCYKTFGFITLCSCALLVPFVYIYCLLKDVVLLITYFFNKYTKDNTGK